MRYEHFLEEVREHTGVDSTSQALRIARITLRVLGEALLEHDRQNVAAGLPDPLARALTAGPSGKRVTARSFYDRIARREGVRPGFGLEHAQVVCQALTHTLRDETLLYLESRLPPDLAELFVDRRSAHGSIPVVRPHHRNETETIRGRTLATGRPGSSRPLSEARPDNAHSESVIKSANPHGDRKISSSHTGEEALPEGDTMATGRPGSRRPISEVHD